MEGQREHVHRALKGENKTLTDREIDKLLVAVSKTVCIDSIASVPLREQIVSGEYNTTHGILHLTAEELSDLGMSPGAVRAMVRLLTECKAGEQENVMGGAPPDNLSQVTNSTVAIGTAVAGAIEENPPCPNVVTFTRASHIFNRHCFGTLAPTGCTLNTL